MVAFKNMTMHWAAKIADFYKQGKKKRRKIWLKLGGDFNPLVEVLLSQETVKLH
jgi:hypothetical protein